MFHDCSQKNYLNISLSKTFLNEKLQVKLAGEHLLNRRTVSYTHLDVYKRQGIDSAYSLCFGNHFHRFFRRNHLSDSVDCNARKKIS